MTIVGGKQNTRDFYIIAEIVIVFLTAFIFLKLTLPLAKDNLILKQATIWVANVLMLVMVWLGLRYRDENYSAFGLTFKCISWRQALKSFLLSLMVLVLAIAGFMIGSIIMANITGVPESANMSSYDYLKNNFGMLLLTLAGVYIVSSFGEEVIYRGFLINRISQLGFLSKWATIIAVLLSSIIFGFAHYEWAPWESFRPDSWVWS